MENEQCSWYQFQKTNSNLDKFIKERTITGEQKEWCDSDDNQIISVSYVRCVKLSEITIPSPWAPQRTADIQKWATPDTLRTLKFYTNENNQKIMLNALPLISRAVDLRKEKQEKFTIGDGIHRINMAKELGLDCILCEVEESVTLSQDQLNEYIAQVSGDK